MVVNNNYDDPHIIPPRIYRSLPMTTDDSIDSPTILPLVQSFDYIFAEFGSFCSVDYCYMLPFISLLVTSFRGFRFCIGVNNFAINEKIIIRNTGKIRIGERVRKFDLTKTTIHSDGEFAFCIDKNNKVRDLSYIATALYQLKYNDYNMVKIRPKYVAVKDTPVPMEVLLTFQINGHLTKPAQN